MMRTPIWTTAFALLAGGALAAPSMDDPVRAPGIERPAFSETWTPSEGWALEQLMEPSGMELADEEIQVARKNRKKEGGGRGGARSKNRGGFSKGNERNASRGGGSARDGGSGGRGDGARAGGSGDRGGDRSVDRDIDRDIDADDLDDAYTSDEEKVGAAVVGGVIGLGVGRRISDSSQ